MQNRVNFALVILSYSFAVLLSIPKSSYSQFVPGESTDSGLGGSNTIVGTVSTEAGRMNRRITVRLTTMMRGDRVSSTDDNGNFSFRGLTSGTYSIVIDKEKEFEPFMQAVDIIQLRGSPPQTYTLSVRLKPKARSLPRPGVVDATIVNLPEKVRGLFTKAQELAKAGDHSGAVEQLLLLTNEFQDFMMGFNELGLEYMRLNQAEKADAAFQQAEKIDPTAIQPKLNRGMLYVMLKRYAEAEPILQNAKKLDERSGTVAYFLGQALANLGKFDEAEKELTKAVSSGGDEMKEAHRILAVIYSSRGDKKRAAAELETYLKMNPSAPDADQLKRVLDKLKADKE